MSDARLRDLERRWRETGAAQDEAAYLNERVRTGEMDARMLTLASYCSYPAAVMAVCVRPPDTTEEFIYSLDQWGIAAIGRAAVSMATFSHDCALRFRLPQPANEDQCGGVPDSALLRAALMNAARQIISPDTPNNRSETELRFSRVDRDIRPLHWENIPTEYAPDESLRFHFATQAALYACGCVISTDVISALENAQEVYSQAGSCTVDNPGLRRAMRESLLAWALGNDPLPALLARLQAEARA